MGRDYTQVVWMRLRLRRNGRENAAAPNQVDYIEQELLFTDTTTAILTTTEMHV
jgi:hypothetical protein